MCNGALVAIRDARKCIVPMEDIISQTGLPRDSLIRVKVKATNAQGTGEFSELNTVGATIETIPTSNLLVTIDMSEAATSNIKTKVTWTALTGSNRGGKDVTIDSYEVFMMDMSVTPTPTYASLGTTTNLYKDVTSLTGGVNYKFKVRGINKYGNGPDSPEVLMLTSQAPEKPAAPVVSVADANVKIEWTAPFANYRDVTSYRILIKTKAGDYIERTDLCNGVAQASVRFCLVDMHSLRLSPFSLVFDDLVQAKVLARNERGWSAESDPNTVGA